MGWQNLMKDGVPFVAMILMECGEVGMTTITKAALNVGMNNFVYIVYYNALGVLFLLPYFIFHNRSIKLPPLTRGLFYRFALLGFLGKCMEILGITGIGYASPTLAAALGNLTPVFTFLLAIMFRMEKIDIRSSSSQAKSVGTIIAVTGALLVTLYKGPAIINSPPSSLPNIILHLSQQSSWVLGGSLLAIGYIFQSTWIVLQAATMKEYPDELTLVFYFTLFGTIQCAIFSLIVERNISAWTFQPGIEIYATLYSGLFGIIRSGVTAWCLYRTGPLFVALIKPLAMVIAMITGVVFLRDVLYLGSLIGAVIIAIGFYSVIWGQANEDEIIIDDATKHTPLLHDSSTLV